MGLATLGVFAGVGIATAIASQVLAANGKGDLAKQTTLAVELVMWGVVISLAVSDCLQAISQIGSLGGSL